MPKMQTSEIKVKMLALRRLRTFKAALDLTDGPKFNSSASPDG